jgi:hypothetical protein
MTSEEYFRMLDLVRGDIETAIGCSSTYLTINRLGAGDRAVAQKYNRHADFWRATTYALQAGLFMALGRVFDNTKNTYTIEDVVEETIDHPGFFTKAELRTRMREAWKIYDNQPDPDLLTERVAGAWEPSRRDLEILRRELEPYVKKFREVYEPIRHKYFAHRGKDSKEAIAELFRKAVITELADILRFAYGMVRGLHDMAINARPPGKWSDKHYDSLFKEYEKSAVALVNSLGPPVPF